MFDHGEMMPSEKSTPSKKSKSRMKKRSLRGAIGQSILKHFFQPGPLIVTAFVMALFVLIPFLPHLLPDLSAQAEYQFEMEQIQINAPNDWVPASLLDDVLREADLPATVSILERDLCRRVALAFESNPWVESVESVSITGKPGLQAVIHFRQPVAFVETPRGLYAVDHKGVLLPPQDFAISETDRLPRINNIRSQPTEIGKPWNDPIVISAAQLAVHLVPDGDMDQYWTRFGLAQILAPTITREGDEPIRLEELNFELSMNDGSHIVWGHPPGGDSLEPTIEQKLERMEYLANSDRLDASGGPYRIDIRLFDSISLEPMNNRSMR